MTMADKIAVMNLGVLQQYDTPRNIYEHPKNLFVAGFIGSPSMNFIECTLVEEDGRAYLDSGEFRIEVTEFRDLIAKEAPGNELILGVRPEHVIVGPHPSTKYALQGKVYVVEPLGDQMILNFKIGSFLVKAIVPPTFEASVGDKLWLSLEREKLHIIDKKTGKVIM
ncbi:TPA: ABC transporter ATP-binding protein [Candidatus Bathyarchaeota archaeon]|nr:ABC transporter ATP-binding protein [Candidatus Bathyarchaeota archaeon]